MFDEANDIALVLKAGALPAPVTILEERTVGATLGPELITQRITAALVGVIPVVLFMILYYRVPGSSPTWRWSSTGCWCSRSWPSSVHADPARHRRVRAHARHGGGRERAHQRAHPRGAARRAQRAPGGGAGYDKVFWTIVDGHVTTLVAGVILMQYGSGPVRGFAVTLIIGLLASMFTSIVVTRAIVMDYFTRRRHGARSSV